MIKCLICICERFDYQNSDFISRFTTLIPPNNTIKLQIWCQNPKFQHFWYQNLKFRWQNHKPYLHSNVKSHPLSTSVISHPCSDMLLYNSSLNESIRLAPQGHWPYHYPISLSERSWIAFFGHYSTAPEVLVLVDIWCRQRPLKDQWSALSARKYWRVSQVARTSIWTWSMKATNITYPKDRRVISMFS